MKSKKLDVDWIFRLLNTLSGLNSQYDFSEDYKEAIEDVRQGVMSKVKEMEKKHDNT